MTVYFRHMNLADAVKNMRGNISEKFFEHKKSVRWVLAVVVASTITILYALGVFERLELLTVDYRFLLRHQKPADSDIIFVDMAEDSIEAIGRWPWPRQWHAAITKILSEHKPKAIVFDVLFSEPQDEPDDLALEEAIKQSGVVYLPISYNLKKEGCARLYAGEGVSCTLEPLARFAKWLKGIGHITVITDQDGILRRVYPVIKFNGRDVYQLGVKVGADSAGLKSEDMKLDPGKHIITCRREGSAAMKIPLDDNNQLIINWQNKWGKEFKHVSYIDIIRSYAQIKEGKAPVVDLEMFKDKICIIGLTALGLTDIKPIPIEKSYPAVGANAMVAYSVIKNSFINITHKEFNIILIVIISVLFTLYLSGLRPLGGLIAASISIAGYFIISVVIFNIFNTLILTFYPILAISFSYGLTAAYTQILQSIERSRLFRQATRDGLTGLYNVRHFNLLIEAELKNAAVDKTKKFSIIMFDIDNFKKLNDTYGHQAGDTILREFAKTMQSKCRQTDIVARYGGEEFIIMLIGAAQKDAADVAEKIRAALADKKFKFGNDTYSTSVSIGVVQYSTEKTREEIVEKADKALYNSKHTGKNRYTVYTPELEQLSHEEPAKKEEPPH